MDNISPRDYFAGQALSALISSLHLSPGNQDLILCKVAFEIADKMMIERDTQAMIRQTPHQAASGSNLMNMGKGGGLYESR